MKLGVVGAGPGNLAEDVGAKAASAHSKQDSVCESFLSDLIRELQQRPFVWTHGIAHVEPAQTLANHSGVALPQCRIVSPESLVETDSIDFR